MAKWELNEKPELIPVAHQHYDKILDEVAEILYREACSSKGQWLDPNSQYSSMNDGNMTVLHSAKAVQKPSWRSA